MNPQAGEVEARLRRLLEWSLFQYERRFYQRHVQITDDDAKDRLQQVWSALSATLANDPMAAGIRECLFVFWPVGTTASVTTPQTLFVQSDHPEHVTCHRAKSPIDTIRGWLDDARPVADRLPDAVPHVYKIVCTYFLSDLGEQPDRLDAFLERRVLIAEPQGYRYVTSDGASVATDLQAFCNALGAEPAGGVFYQRLAVGLACDSPAVVAALAPIVREVIGVVISDWSTQVLEETTAELRLQAWAHELYKVCPRLEGVRLCLEDRAKDAPHSSLGDLASIVKRCSDWIQMYTASSGAGGKDRIGKDFRLIDEETEPALNHLIEWAARVSCFKRFPEKTDFEGASKSRERLTRLEFSPEAEFLRTAVLTCGGDWSIEAAFAQAFLVAVANGLEHAIREGVHEPGEMLALVVVSRRRISVVNRRSVRADGNVLYEGGSNAALRVALKALGIRRAPVFQSFPVDHEAIEPLRAFIDRTWIAVTGDVWVTAFDMPDLWTNEPIGGESDGREKGPRH
jgi:hypothetical protein